MSMTLASKIKMAIRSVEVRMADHPTTASEWREMSRQLRTAGEQARKIALLAERMEGPSQEHANG